MLICTVVHRAPAAGEVQQASADLVKNWGKLKEQWVTAEQRASERFFSRTFEPMPRRARTAAAAAAAGGTAPKLGCAALRRGRRSVVRGHVIVRLWHASRTSEGVVMRRMGGVLV